MELSGRGLYGVYGVCGRCWGVLGLLIMDMGLLRCAG